MTDQQALLGSICSTPADDTVRLAYADWCDENAEPERAEFVRLQVRVGEIVSDEFPHMTKNPHDLAELDRLQRREQMILADPHNFLKWVPSVMHTGSGAGIRYETGGIVGLFGKGFESAEFRRGFIESVTCTIEVFLEHAEDIFSAHPVTAVTITNFGSWNGPIIYPHRVSYPHLIRITNVEKLHHGTVSGVDRVTYLPVSFKSHIKGGHVREYGDREHRTREEYERCLSDGMVSWARSRKSVGLPPLRETSAVTTDSPA